MYACICMYVYVCMYMCVCICMYVCMCVCMCVCICVCMHTCICMYAYYIGGNCPKGKCPTQNGRGNCSGGIVQGEMSYTHLISLSQCSSLIMPVQPLQRLKKEGGAANNTCNDTACLMSNYPTKDRQKARRLLRRKRSIDYIDKSSSWSC